MMSVVVDKETFVYHYNLKQTLKRRICGTDVTSKNENKWVNGLGLLTCGKNWRRGNVTQITRYICSLGKERE